MLTTGGITSSDQVKIHFTHLSHILKILQTVGAEAIIDATVVNTPIFIQNSNSTHGSLAGSLVLNNIHLTNVPTAVGVTGGTIVLAGSSGTTTIPSWVQGNVYKGTNAAGTFTQGSYSSSASKPAVLLDSSGKIFGKSHPQYATYATSQFVSVRSNGATGDGRTDDIAALQAVLNKVWNRQTSSLPLLATEGTMMYCSTRGVASYFLMLGRMLSHRHLPSLLEHKWLARRGR